MKIAFISGNREKLPDATIPLGILSVMASVPDQHPMELVDLCFEDEPLRTLAERLQTLRPELVALGMRNIQNSDYSGSSAVVDYYGELIDAIRESSDAPIAMGGSGFSVMPRELMARLRPDYGISGEAEAAFPALLDALEKGAGFEDIPSLHRFEAGQLVSNPAPPRFIDMNTLPFADRSRVDSRYYSEYGIESLQTKRGCPLRCDYCTYPIIEGRIGRTRDPAVVVDDLFAILAQHPETQHVFVVDSVFNLPRAHAKAVCREMIERGSQIPWTCYANPLGFDAELASLMAEAGCAGMEVGADSGTDEALLTLRKGFTTAQIRDLHALAQTAGIPDCHTFLLGTPGESMDDVQRTLDFIVDLDPYCAILMAWVDDYDALDPVQASERRALRESVLQLLEDHKDEFSWWSIPSLGVNYDPRLFTLLRKSGLTGPLWQHLRQLNTAKPRRRRARRRQS